MRQIQISPAGFEEEGGGRGGEGSGTGVSNNRQYMGEAPKDCVEQKKPGNASHKTDVRDFLKAKGITGPRKSWLPPVRAGKDGTESISCLGEGSTQPDSGQIHQTTC